MPITIAEFAAKLGLDLDGAAFEEAIKGIEGIRTGLKAIGVLAGATAGALLGLIESTAHAGEEAGKTAEQIGVSTDALQEMQYAAKVSGVDAETLTQGMRLLARQMYEASLGSKDAKDAFAALGITTTDGQGRLLSTEDVIEQVADKFQEMGDTTERTALAQKVFGRSGAALIPLLNKGADGIEEFRKEARELGVVLDESTIRASEEFHASQVRAGQAVVGLRNAIAGPLISAVTPMLESFTRWVALHRQIIATRVHQFVHAVAVAFRAVASVVKAVIGVFKILIHDHFLLAEVIGVVTAALILFKGQAILAGAAAIGSAIATAAAWLIAAAPIALIVALLAIIVLTADEIYHTLKGDRTLLSDLFDKWGDLMQSWEFGSDKDGWLIRDLKAAIGFITHLGDAWEAFKISIGIEQPKTLSSEAGSHRAVVDAQGNEIKGEHLGPVDFTDPSKGYKVRTADGSIAIGRLANVGEYNAQSREAMYAQFRQQQLEARIGAVAAPGAPPALAPAAAPGDVTFAPTFHITQQDGEDGEALAHRVSELTGGLFDAQLRQAREGNP